MAEIYSPPLRQRNDLSQLLQIGGAVGGAIAGGPGVGAALGGAATGASLGGLAGGMISKPMAQNSAMGVGSPYPESNAMMRRTEQLSQDNLGVLKLAEASLPSLPEELRQQYSVPIIQARMLEEKNRGLV